MVGSVSFKANLGRTKLSRSHFDMLVYLHCQERGQFWCLYVPMHQKRQQPRIRDRGHWKGVVAVCKHCEKRHVLMMHFSQDEMFSFLVAIFIPYILQTY